MPDQPTLGSIMIGVTIAICIGLYFVLKKIKWL